MTRHAPIPVTLITGFLGAGKTTLLNRLLDDPALKGAAVIINEFGDVGLDHLFVSGGDEGIVELSSGCLCCTIRGDLVSTLEDLLRRLDNGRIDSLSRVVIETTGLADPAPILHAVMLHPYLVQRYRLDGVVTLVDAVNGQATLEAHGEARKQAAMADRLVLTKTDLLGENGDEARAALVSRLKALNPTARILDAGAGEAAPSALLDVGLYNPETKSADVRRWLAEEQAQDTHTDGHASGHTHGHTLGHTHAHDVNRHSDTIRSFSLTTDVPVKSRALEMFLDLLTSAHGPKLLRLKGIVCLAEEPDQPLVLHAVQHVLHPPFRLPAWPDADHRTRLVFIVDGLAQGFVERLFDAFTDTPAVDTPDTAAMLDNPLAIPGASMPGTPRRSS